MERTSFANRGMADGARVSVLSNPAIPPDKSSAFAGPDLHLRVEARLSLTERASTKHNEDNHDSQPTAHQAISSELQNDESRIRQLSGSLTIVTGGRTASATTQLSSEREVDSYADGDGAVLLAESDCSAGSDAASDRRMKCDRDGDHSATTPESIRRERAVMGCSMQDDAVATKAVCNRFRGGIGRQSGVIATSRLP